MSKKVTLKSSEGETFEIDEVVALKSQTIKNMIEEDFTDNDGIQLRNVKGKILANVIECCKKHVENPGIDEELRSWDAEFVKVDQETLFDLIMKVTLKSSDGETFEINESVAFESKTIKDMLEEDFTKSVIQLPKVTGAILAKVFKYCKKHIERWDGEVGGGDLQIFQHKKGFHPRGTGDQVGESVGLRVKSRQD